MTDTTPSEINRRHMLLGGASLPMANAAGASAAGASVMASCARKNVTRLEEAPHWMTLLGTSEQGGRDYAPEIEGEIPARLRGSLYRNGPGLFERGDSRVAHMLDGDGLIQRLAFSDGGVRYRNQFVRTRKFVQEETSGKREYATWTTRKNANPFDNIGGGDMKSQAGVTVYPVHGKLIARDEIGPSYEIDAEDLSTLGMVDAASGGEGTSFKAHSKLDPETGEWIIAGNAYGRSMQIHAEIYEPTLALKKAFSFEAPRQVYFHDFIASRNYLIFVLHPCYPSIVPFLAGLKSFTDSFQWKPEEGTVVAVVPRHGGAAKFYEAPASFMWHALNAFEDGDELIADFVGYDEPDHFIGDDALLKTLMQGRLGRSASPGKIRRYRINLAGGALSEEILDHGNHEFPMVDERAAMGRQRIGYFSYGGLGALNSGLKRLDYDSGEAQIFDFGAETQIGEPVFARNPGGGVDEGWLIAQCLDGASEKSFFAIFDAQLVDKGPTAKVWLTHHAPISFHGAWSA